MKVWLCRPGVCVWIVDLVVTPATLLSRLPATGLCLDRDSAAKAVAAAAAAAAVTLIARGAPAAAASKHHHPDDNAVLLALAGSCIVSVGRGMGEGEWRVRGGGGKARCS